MKTYKHTKTGQMAILQSQTESTVIMLLDPTNEPKSMATATFKRWWKKVENKETEISDSEAATSLSDVVKTLEILFDKLNTIYFENKLPRAIITIQTTPKAYGHCSVKKIWKFDSPDLEPHYEINLGAEYINREGSEVACTLLHEMVHLYHNENGIRGTSQGRRYHNKNFKQDCEVRDLEVGYDSANGYTYTSPSEAFKNKIQEADFIWNVSFSRFLGKKSGSENNRAKAHKYICPACGQTVKTTADLSLICGVDNEVMTKYAS